MIELLFMQCNYMYAYVLMSGVTIRRFILGGSCSSNTAIYGLNRSTGMRLHTDYKNTHISSKVTLYPTTLKPLDTTCSSRPALRFSVREKMLALAIYLENPSLYKWLSTIFHLPSKLILERWLEGVARADPENAKKIVYNVYTRHIFKP